MPESNSRNLRFTLDPFQALEFPAAVFCLNITVFTILWKSVGLDWLPFGLDTHFQEIFSEGYYPRDQENHEFTYRLFFFLLYGVLGTAAQLASLRIAQLRRTERDPGLYRYLFGGFHLLIAIYHVLFVFRIVQGKMILDGMASWQVIASRVLYLLELLMAIELFTAKKSVFFRRKVCLDLLSACNLLPFLVYWIFAIAGYNDPWTTKFVEYSFFAILPLSLLAVEWGSHSFANIQTFRQPTPGAM